LIFAIYPSIFARPANVAAKVKNQGWIYLWTTDVE